jgi:group I intron endonuclease
MELPPEGLGCVYAITNTINNRIYVGKTKYNSPWKRFYQHWASARKAANTPLQRDMIRYGIEHFTIDVLCFESIENLDECEIFWAETLETYIWAKPSWGTRGYNAIKCGNGTSRNQNKPSKETILRLQQYRRHSWKGRKHRPESKYKIGANWRGKKFTDQHKMKISNSHLGKKQSVGHRLNARNKRIESVERNGAKGVKLNKKIVLEIVESINAGQKMTSVAHKYNVEISVISRIMSGDRWGYVTGIPKKATSKHKSPILGMNIANYIRTLYATREYSYQQLAKKYEVNKSTIANIIKNKLYPID